MHIRQLFSWSGPLTRKHYFFWGIILFAIKYNWDRLLAWEFGKKWFITDYFILLDQISFLDLNPEDQKYYLYFLLSSLPFIWFGTTLTLKRLRDTGLSSWWVLLFFIPYLNFLFFAILSILPSSQRYPKLSTDYLRRLIPKSKWGSIGVALGIAISIALLQTLFFLHALEAYGWGLFVGVPFFLGFASVLLYSHHNEVRFWGAVGICLLAALAFSGITFLMAVEGVICLLMAYPILAVLSVFGGIIAYAIVRKSTPNTVNVMLVPLFSIILLGIIEDSADRKPGIFSVETAVLIEAEPQEIWDELVAFSTIEDPEELIFKTGIAYPTHAHIEGEGVGAVRYCHFTTGAFVEPITVWDEPYKLAFSVRKQPPPMMELSFYENLELAHLDGYFLSQKGQFELEDKGDGTVLLKGTTWYTHDVWPTPYWRLWSDAILHKIHYRVLNHIREKAERK